jgi:hypothetical protein
MSPTRKVRCQFRLDEPESAFGDSSADTSATDASAILSQSEIDNGYPFGSADPRSNWHSTVPGKFHLIVA